MSWANFFPPVTWEPIASVRDGGLPLVDVGLLANAQHQMLNPFVVYSRTNATPVAAARRNRKNMMACMCRRKIGKYVKKKRAECELDETNPDPDLLRNRGRVVHVVPDEKQQIKDDRQQDGDGQNHHRFFCIFRQEGLSVSGRPAQRVQLGQQRLVGGFEPL